MTADNVIVVSINQSSSGVVVVFYISVPDGADIVSAADIVDALQDENAKTSFARFGLTLAKVSVANPMIMTTQMPTGTPTSGKETKPTGLSTGEIVGITFAVMGAVILLLILLMYATVLFLVVFKYYSCS